MAADKSQYTVADYLKSAAGGALKLHRTYDASNRVQTQYECPTQTPDGGICLRTDYQYVGTSARVAGMKETLDLWQAAWDF